MLCEHGNVSPCVECDIEPLRAENKKLREKVEALVEALEAIERMDYSDHSLINAVLVARAAHRKQEASHDNQ